MKMCIKSAGITEHLHIFINTCTKSLLLDHLEELFVSPSPTIHYCYGVWQHGFQDMKDAGIQFHEGVPTTFHLQK